MPAMPEGIPQPGGVVMGGAMPDIPGGMVVGGAMPDIPGGMVVGGAMPPGGAMPGMPAGVAMGGAAVQIEGMPGGVAMGGAVQIEGMPDGVAMGAVEMEAMPDMPSGPASDFFIEYRFVRPIKYSGYRMVFDEPYEFHPKDWRVIVDCVNHQNGEREEQNLEI